MNWPNVCDRHRLTPAPRIGISARPTPIAGGGESRPLRLMNDPKNRTEAEPVIGAVIITHGHLASEFIAAAEMIVGPIPHVTPASIDWHDDIDVARAELERAIIRVSHDRGVLLLTDMFGG